MIHSQKNHLKGQKILIKTDIHFLQENLKKEIKDIIN